MDLGYAFGMTTLVRPEPLITQSIRWSGSVRLTQPIGRGLAALIGLALTLLLGLFAAFGTNTAIANVIEPLVLGATSCAFGIATCVRTLRSSA